MAMQNNAGININTQISLFRRNSSDKELNLLIFLLVVYEIYIFIYTFLYSFVIWIAIWLDDYLMQNSDNWILAGSSKKSSNIWDKNLANILCTWLGIFLCLRCISQYMLS